MINAGVKLVTDNARKEAAGDGAIGAPATTAAASTMGKIYLVANDGGISGTYVEFITIDKGPDSTGASGYVRYVWEQGSDISCIYPDRTSFVHILFQCHKSGIEISKSEFGNDQESLCAKISLSAVKCTF